MTINIETTQLQIKSFEAEVFRAYQKDDATLKKLCRVRQIAGTSHQFPKYDTLAAVARIVGTPIVTSNQNTAKVEVSISRWSVATYSDIFLQNEVNFDDKEEAIYAVVSAANRKIDQTIIDALEAQRTANPSYTNSVAKSIGGADTSLNVAKFAEIAKLWDAGNVKREERHLVVHSNAYHKFTQETKVASSDYNNYQVLKTGAIPAYYGINIHTLGNIDNENGLTLSSNTRYNYAVQKMALGYVENKTIQTRVDYVPAMASDLISCFFSSGCKVIEEKGIVVVATHEA